MKPTHALCLRTVEDDLGVYNIKGKCYEIYEDHGDTLVIESEDVEDVLDIQIKRDDPSFLLVYRRD